MKEITPKWLEEQEREILQQLKKLEMPVIEMARAFFPNLPGGLMNISMKARRNNEEREKPICRQAGRQAINFLTFDFACNIY